MLMVRERPLSARALDGWAIGVLLEAHAIRICEQHGFMQCRGDPDARDRALATARAHPPAGLSGEAAVASLHDMLSGMGDTCPEC